MIKTYELKPTSQKSYYGKANVIETETGTFLKSYNTIVCGIVNGSFKRLWSGYSHTTAKHVSDFRKLFSFSAINKKEWDAMEVSENA